MVATGAKARELLEAWRWRPELYERCKERLQKRTRVYEGEAGFFPPTG